MFCEIDVPAHRNDHVVAAALRADPERVQETGRRLVRHSPERCSALVGLALLATDRSAEDLPLLRTIGLLSDSLGPLAVTALERRRGGEEALLWLAQRVFGWGRIHVVEALGRQPGPAARHWLLRHACNGDELSGYFAGKVATAAQLHEAVTGKEIDDDLVDHTGRLLARLTQCNGMGMTLEDYPPAPHVLAAHAAHLGRQAPTGARHRYATTIAEHLAKPDQPGDRTGQYGQIAQRYREVLERPDWRAAGAEWNGERIPGSGGGRVEEVRRRGCGGVPSPMDS